MENKILLNLAFKPTPLALATRLMATLLLLTVTAAGPAAADPSAWATFYVRGGLPYLPVKMVGTQGQTVDATLLLDTGTGPCILSEAMVKRLGVKPQQQTGPDGKAVLFDGQPNQAVTVPMLEIGTLSGADIPTLVAHDRGRAGFLDAAGVDGILGGNVLAFQPTFLDYQNGRAAFFTHSPVTAEDLHSVGMDGAVAVSVHETSPGSDRIACRVGLSNAGSAVEADLMVDTGADFASIPALTAQRLGVPRHPAQYGGTTVGGRVDRLKMTVSVLTLGGLPPSGPSGPPSSLVLRDVDVMYPKGKDFDPEYLAPGIGANVLARFRVLLDYGGKVMYLAPVGAPPVNPAPAAVTSSPVIPAK